MNDKHQYHEMDPNGDLVLILGSSSHKAEEENNTGDSVSKTLVSEEPASKIPNESANGEASSGEFPRSIVVGNRNDVLFNAFR
jgi:hypothetical protein